MMTGRDFSYEHYCQLIKRLQGISPLKDFSEIKPSDPAFFILRHDVEFSVERAYELAKLEHEALNITSSYFFQIRNYTYNVLSRQNIDLIQRIHALGHHIGLHVNFQGVLHKQSIEELIKQDVAILAEVVGLPIDRFSFHRPSKELLQSNLKIPGLINAYSFDYFQFDDDAIHHKLDITYLSDSEHRWKYGEPMALKNRECQKIQLLIHPYSWSLKGLNNKENFEQLIAAQFQALLHAMHEECHHFPIELLDEKR